MTKIGDIYYRYEEHFVSTGVDEFENPLESEMKITLLKMEVIRITPKGVVLNYFGDQKRIRNTARYKWAYPTREEALISYENRKIRQLGYLKRQIDEIETIIVRIKASRLGRNSLYVTEIESSKSKQK